MHEDSEKKESVHVDLPEFQQGEPNHKKIHIQIQARCLFFLSCSKVYVSVSVQPHITLVIVFFSSHSFNHTRLQTNHVVAR